MQILRRLFAIVSDRDNLVATIAIISAVFAWGYVQQSDEAALTAWGNGSPTACTTQQENYRKTAP